MPKKSNVWKYFTRLTDGHGSVINKARCNYCTDKKEFETKDGTSNLWKHFKKFHPQEAAAAEGAATAAQQPQPPLPPCAPSGSSGASTDHEPMLNEDESLQVIFQRQFKSSTEKVQDMGAAPPLQQQQQQQQTPLPPLPCALSQEPSLEGQAHHEPDVDEKDAIRDLARMIGLHGYDPLVVEDDHFRSFVHRLNPGFKLPSRCKIEEMCAVATPVLQWVKLKSWRRRRKSLYLTCHFIDDQWNLHRVVMDAFKVLPPGGHYSLDPLRGMFMISLDYSDRLLSTIAQQIIYYPFMIAGEMTADFELIIKLKDHLQYEIYYEIPHPDREIICATYMDHVLHSIARFLLPDSQFTADLIWYMDGLSKEEYQEHLSPWDYEERWYSCYCSLEIQIQKLESESNLQILMCNILRVIYRAINKLLASTTPTSNLCLEELFKNVADVLREAPCTVDKAIEDSYMVWSIPLVLDPRYKLRHVKSNFETVFGSESEAANHCTEVTRRLKELYSSYIEDSDDSSEEMAIDSCNPTEQTQDYGESELDCYMQDSPTRPTEDFDILKWWKIYGSVQYPTVARMARDALAMPTCSKLTSDQTAHVRSIIRGYND
ncbi:unnamed protein product [Miscanthus lutarioriparius]|uniref:BED-type domain-containing protein n=1 Tax=Miscanthus lutarioriparius TaxID=422564 RepID=A0A811R8L8_9POAL|nr:unnamed protein product [Miscanthus lutarioriparius]